MALNEVRAPMHKNKQTTMGRISGFYSSGSLFKDINLSSKIYEKESHPFTGKFIRITF